MADIIEELTVPSGHVLRVVVRCARRGEIAKCRLVQWDDDASLLEGFRFTLWSAREACPPGITPAEPEEGRAARDRDRIQYEIGDPVEAEPGKVQAEEDGKPAVQSGWSYRNRDNGGSQTNMLRQIYLELVDRGPVDADRPKRYKLFLTIEPKSE